MGFGSIPVAILPSCPDMKTIALKTIYVGSKNKKHLRGSIQATYSLRQLNDSCPTGFGQYNSLGEYCIPHTASSVFLMLILSCHEQALLQLRSRKGTRLQYHVIAWILLINTSGNPGLEESNLMVASHQQMYGFSHSCRVVI